MDAIFPSVFEGTAIVAGVWLILWNIRDAAAIWRASSTPLPDRSTRTTGESLQIVAEANRRWERARCGFKSVIVGVLLMSGGLTMWLHLGEYGSVLMLLLGAGAVLTLIGVNSRAREARRAAFDFVSRSIGQRRSGNAK